MYVTPPRAVFLNLFLPRGTLGYLHRYLAAPSDAKIGLKVHRSDNFGHP